MHVLCSGLKISRHPQFHQQMNKMQRIIFFFPDSKILQINSFSRGTFMTTYLTSNCLSTWPPKITKWEGKFYSQWIKSSYLEDKDSKSSYFVLWGIYVQTNIRLLNEPLPCAHINILYMYVYLSICGISI